MDGTQSTEISSASAVPGGNLSKIDFATLQAAHDLLSILADACGYKPDMADVEVEIPHWENEDDPSLHDAIGKALEAGYGNVVGMTIDIKRG